MAVGGRAYVFGVPVDALPAREAQEHAWALLEAASPGRPALILTPNPELIMRARREPDLLAAARAADIALPDGVGVVWAARRQGLAVPERVPGVEFMDALLGRAAAAGRPVYLLGGRPGVAPAAARRARERFGDLRVAGLADGYFPPERAGEVARQIADSGAELLFAGLGMPRQERFLCRHRGELGAVRLAMGVGGSLDVLAGAVRRAPPAVRRVGLEWLWRLVGEPRRWRRQLALPRFAWAVVTQRGGAHGR